MFVNNHPKENNVVKSEINKIKRFIARFQIEVVFIVLGLILASNRYYCTAAVLFIYSGYKITKAYWRK